MRLENVLKMPWKRLEDVLKTYGQDEYIDLDQDVFKTSSEDKDERGLQDVFKTSSSRRMFAGIYIHCLKSVPIWSFLRSISSRIQPEKGKIRTRKKIMYLYAFHTVIYMLYINIYMLYIYIDVISIYQYLPHVIIHLTQFINHLKIILENLQSLP